MSSKAKAVKRPSSPSTGDKKLPGNEAKKQMCSIFSEPAPPPVRHIRANRSGDSTSTALCKVQGVVTRTKDETVTGPKGPIFKRRIDIVVTGVIGNGAQDIVRTGVEGEVFIFPSKVVDTPETAESNDKFKGSARELVVSAMQPVRKLSTFSSSFYKDTKDGAESAVCMCDVGMLVEITGVCVNAVTKNGVTNFYLNGGKVSCMMDKAPTKGIVARHMMNLVKQDKMQEWSAFSGSIAMKGFFDSDHLAVMSEVQKHQAMACQGLWQRLVEGAADRLGVMQQGKDEEIAAQLAGHEQRIRASAPAKIASGDLNLFLTGQYDSTLMPVLQKGMAPWNSVPEFVKKLQGTPEEQATLPNMFTAPWVVNVETRGKALNVDMRIAYIFNKEAAIEAFDKGDEGSPLLCTSSAGASMTLSMRDFAVKFGSLLQPKVEMACASLVRTGDFAAFIKMSNIEEGGDEAIKTDFPEGGTIYMDVSSTLARHSVLVSEGFIKTNLCGGGTQYVPAKVAAAVEKLEFPPGVADMPDLDEYGYQELTYDAFDIDNWTSLDGEVEYRVVYPGMYEMLKGDDERGTGEVYTTDPAKGEAFMKGLQPGLDQPKNMKKYLVEQCLVYARIA